MPREDEQLLASREEDGQHGERRVDIRLIYASLDRAGTCGAVRAVWRRSALLS